MRITITNDEGDVFAILRNVQLASSGQSRAIDEEGEEVRIDSVLDDAAIWEKAQNETRRAAREAANAMVDRPWNLNR
jgi:hypothetical protein